ncbi:MAG: serine/threonine-protein kinase [Mariniblastus sp.]|nr:serine/threonine-protein kinase [Mariniblastus sp.]
MSTLNSKTKKKAQPFGEDRLTMIFVGDVEGEPPPKISNSFKKYTHFRDLKSGGKASLVSCKDTNLGRRVVLKMLRPELNDDKVELRRLLREARITAQLQHPATVPMYELGQNEEGQWFFAMKHIEGHTLFEIIVGLARKEKAMEEAFNLNRLLGILTQVGDALSYAHVRGVIHRDIKPENIIVGMFGEVTLIDWGAAKVWGMPNDGDEDTKGQRGGTPLYMSPEQVTGNRLVDERTDIFSLGVVMYEMMCQREPFRGRNIAETFNNILQKDPVPPREVAPHRQIPIPLENICLKAIQKNPNDRFTTMLEMMEAINKFRSESLSLHFKKNDG